MKDSLQYYLSVFVQVLERGKSKNLLYNLVSNDICLQVITLLLGNTHTVLHSHFVKLFVLLLLNRLSKWFSQQYFTEKMPRRRI